MYYSDSHLEQQQQWLYSQANQLITLDSNIQCFLSTPLLQQQTLALTLPYQPIATANILSNHNDKCYINQLHPLYPILHNYLQTNLLDIAQSFNNKAIPPYCQLLFTCDKDFNIRQFIHYDHNAMGEILLTIKLAAITHLEQLIQQLYQQHNSHSFKSLLRAYIRPEKDTIKSYRQYVNGLFQKYSRLLVIRVDLGYHSNQTIGYPQFCQDIDQFISLMPSNPAFKDKVGYIWKLEYGPQKGFHVHLMLLYDGAKRKSDYYIAQQIGELWRQITSLRGLYYNCHSKAQKQAYVIDCLGMLHRSDSQRINHLTHHVVAYLTKTDPYLKLLNNNGRKLTDRGQMPKLSVCY